jgi:hypothetical protein
MHTQEAESDVASAKKLSQSLIGAQMETSSNLAVHASGVTVKSTVDFCTLVRNIAYYAEASGCNVIHEAGVIPLLFALIARRITDADVVLPGCIAVLHLARNGSAEVKASMRSIPDYAGILNAAEASGFEKHDGESIAALALKALQ